MDNKPRKARFILAVILLLLSQVSGSQDNSIDWLEISEDVLQFWVTEIPADSPFQMKVSPKWRRREADIPKRIVGIVPKKSSSYSLAATELLRVFRDYGIYADISITNFGNDNRIGQDILKTAEAQEADLIFSMGSESADLVSRYYTGERIPVVTCTNKDPVMLGQVGDYKNGSGTNIAYTSLNVPLDIQQDYLFRLKPDLVNIGLLYNSNHVQVMATEVVPVQEEFGELGVKVIDVAVSSMETARDELRLGIPAAIAEMKKTDPDLSNSVFWVTSSTAVFSNMDILSNCCQAVPVLSSIPNAVTEGEDSAVLAIGIDRRNNAHLAAIYAARILKGEVLPGELPVGIVTPPDVAINFRVARKIGLKIPLSFFESAAFIYDYEGRLARAFGETVK